MRRLGLGIAPLAVLGLVSCSGMEAVGGCDDVVSISGFVINLSIGIDNRADDQYAQFRADTLVALGLARAVAGGGYDADVDAMDAGERLATDLSAFVDEMDRFLWDASRAASDEAVYDAWEAASSADSLARANMVEAAIIDECGLPALVEAEGEGPVVLPFPSVPSPTATDPPTSGIDEDAEAFAMGRVLSDIYQLALDDEDVLCIGRQMLNIENMTSSRSDAQSYENQFQRAFTNCGIDFTVPQE